MRISSAQHCVVNAIIRLLVFAFAFVASAVPALAQTDLRAQYATDSLDAAKAIDRGIKASAEGRSKEALAAFREAVKLDPKCGMAPFQMAIAHADLGEIDEALAALQVVFAPDTRVARNVRAVAATNAGLTCGRLGRLDDAAKWFSRGIRTRDAQTGAVRRRWRASYSMSPCSRSAMVETKP